MPRKHLAKRRGQAIGLTRPQDAPERAPSALTRCTRPAPAEDPGMRPNRSPRDPLGLPPRRARSWTAQDDASSDQRPGIGRGGRQGPISPREFGRRACRAAGRQGSAILLRERAVVTVRDSHTRLILTRRNCDSSSELSKWHHIPRNGRVEVVAPRLHHLRPWRQVEGVVVAG